jgi:hypothetical protein
MNRRILGLGLCLVCSCIGLGGCELLDHEKRSKSNAAVHEHEEGAEKVGAVESAPPKGFFSNSRLSGGLSSEARDVERNLGVP